MRSEQAHERLDATEVLEEVGDRLLCGVKTRAPRLWNRETIGRHALVLNGGHQPIYLEELRRAVCQTHVPAGVVNRLGPRDRRIVRSQNKQARPDRLAPKREIAVT